MLTTADRRTKDVLGKDASVAKLLSSPTSRRVVAQKTALLASLGGTLPGGCDCLRVRVDPKKTILQSQGVIDLGGDRVEVSYDVAVIYNEGKLASCDCVGAMLFDTDRTTDAFRKYDEQLSVALAIQLLEQFSSPELMETIRGLLAPMLILAEAQRIARQA